MHRDADAAWERLAGVRRTPTVTLQWLVASTVGFFAFAYGFGLVLAAGRGRPLEPIVVGVPGGRTPFVALAVAVVCLGVVVTLHEWLHGVFLARYGGHPRYGVGVTYFGLPYAYATVDDETEGGGGAIDESGGTADWGYARNEMLVVLLAPFVLVSLAGLVALAAFPSPLLAFVLAANAAGSVADCWMAAVLLGYPPSARVGALPGAEDGFGIYGPEGRSGRRTLVTKSLSRIAAGALGTYAAFVVAVGLAVLYSLAFETGTVAVDLLGRSLFRHEFHPDRGVALLAIDAPAVAGLSAAGGLCWLSLTALRRLGATLGS